MLSLLAKKCFLCGDGSAKIGKAVFVYGYTRPLKRFFCSEAHLEQYQKVASKIEKVHTPSCRSCCG